MWLSVCESYNEGSGNEADFLPYFQSSPPFSSNTQLDLLQSMCLQSDQRYGNVSKPPHTSQACWLVSCQRGWQRRLMYKLQPTIH